MPHPVIEREFIGVDSPTAGRAGAGGHPCQGLYHRAAGHRPKVAMIATHYQIDFSEHYIAEYMAARDYVAVQGIVILIAIIVAVVNFIVDVIAALVDPRVRY